MTLGRSGRQAYTTPLGTDQKASPKTNGFAEMSRRMAGQRSQQGEVQISPQAPK